MENLERLLEPVVRELREMTPPERLGFLIRHLKGILAILEEGLRNRTT